METRSMRLGSANVFIPGRGVWKNTSESSNNSSAKYADVLFGYFTASNGIR